MMSSLLVAANVEGIVRRLGARKEILVQTLQLGFRQLLDAGNAVLGPLHRDDQLVQLDLQCNGVAILGVLDEEDHQKRDDRGRGVDDKLPGVAESKERTGGSP